MKLKEHIEVIVTGRDLIEQDIVCLTLAYEGGKELPAFEAGSHIELELTDSIKRAYSLCSDPAERSHYQIAVKRELESRGGSSFVHEQIKVGDKITISKPNNYFPVSADTEYAVLVGGGIGITPLLSMAYSLKRQGVPFSVLFCSSRYTHPLFESELADMGAEVHFFNQGKASISMDQVLEGKPDNIDFYCCGPDEFMAHIKTLSGADGTRWHQESFTPASEVVVEGSVTLTLSESNKVIELAPDSSMLDAIRLAGVPVETVCEQGVCGSCVVAWKDGEPVHNDDCMTDEERGEYVALCCAGCRSQSLTLEI